MFTCIPLFRGDEDKLSAKKTVEKNMLISHLLQQL